MAQNDMVYQGFDAAVMSSFPSRKKAFIVMFEQFVMFEQSERFLCVLTTIKQQ